MKHYPISVLVMALGIAAVALALELNSFSFSPEPVVSTAPVETPALNDFSSPYSEAVAVTTHAATRLYTFGDLLDAIEWVESKGDANAIGDNGNAVGSFQIWKIYVDDCNRILGRQAYRYEDRKDRQKSREIVSVVLPHYAKGTEEMARIHNGGPQGHKKDSTKKYWSCVKNYLDNLR